MRQHPEDAARLAYVLFDTSGSTVRNGFCSGCEQTLPMLVDAAGQRPGVLLSMLAYGTDARILVALSDPGDIRLIPSLTPEGLSSLAAGLRLLADTIRRDTAQLAADGVAFLPPRLLVVADGLPTDAAAELLAARDELEAELAAGPDSPEPVCAVPPGDSERLVAAGLGMKFFPLASGGGTELAASVAEAFQGVLP